MLLNTTEDMTLFERGAKHDLGTQHEQEQNRNKNGEQLFCYLAPNTDERRSRELHVAVHLPIVIQMQCNDAWIICSHFRLVLCQNGDTYR